MATTEQVLHMKGGDGETGYAKNSLVQRKVMVRAKPILEECVTNMYCKSSDSISCFRAADLGCSSGPNALMAATYIVTSVYEASRKMEVDAPIFQIFLNDLFGNDFNSVFRSLPQFYHTLFKQQDDKQFIPSKCFVNATPGNFYGRLYPSNSMNFFHSSSSLHWLSQAPKELNNGKPELEVDEEEGNNGYINARSKTSHNHKSHLEQFRKDFRMFLRSRSQELVLGGAMLLTYIGSYGASDITPYGLIQMLLTEMVSQNLIQRAKVDGFSMPVYHPTAEEVREIIEEEGCFSVERIESMRTSWDGSTLDEYDDDSSFVDDNERAEFNAKYLRAAMEPILKAHFGEEDMMIDELFLRFQNKILQLMPNLEYHVLVISLVKSA